MNRHEELAMDILHDLGQADIGMYEVSWRANALFASLPSQERQLIAARAVRYLIESGWAQIIDSREQGEVRNDPSIVDDTSWHATVDPDTRYWLQITPSGHRLTQST
jgi:hypothetical protein